MIALALMVSESGRAEEVGYVHLRPREPSPPCLYAATRERPRIMPLDDDWGEILGDSNGPAYQKTELRSGPPLEYVAEKLCHSLEQLHGLLVSIEKPVPGEPMPPSGAQATAASLRRDGLASAARAAFYYGLVSYLALQNMLSLANDHDLLGRLMAMPAPDFSRWLEVITAEGSVTG
jgi:hypothetical protein